MNGLLPQFNGRCMLFLQRCCMARRTGTRVVDEQLGRLLDELQVRVGLVQGNLEN
jgi:hypothetical protein